MRTTVLLVAGLFAKAESTSPWSTLFDNVRWPAFVLPIMCCCWLHKMQCLPPLTYNFQLLVYRLIVCSVSTLTCRYQKYVVCLRVKSTHEHCSTYIHARKHTRTNAQTRKSTLKYVIILQHIPTHAQPPLRGQPREPVYACKHVSQWPWYHGNHFPF